MSGKTLIFTSLIRYNSSKLVDLVVNVTGILKHLQVQKAANENE